MSDLEAIAIIERGAMYPEDELEAFAQLIKSKTVWRLQGWYQRQAHRLIQAGLISAEGETGQ